MNAFERHGIRNLSPSAINLWRANPALYVGKYLLKWRDDAWLNAWWGDAVEAGLATWLYKRDAALALDAARRAWEGRTMGEVSEEIDAKWAEVGPALDMAKTLFPDHPPPTSFQAWVECWLDGIPVPIRGKTDFQWPDAVDDTKVTGRLPSEPKPDHIGQLAIYARATGKPVFVSYVTTKKAARYAITPEMVADGLAAMTETARTLMQFLGRVRDGHDAITLLPTNPDDYRWNDTLRERMNAERMAA